MLIMAFGWGSASGRSAASGLTEPVAFRFTNYHPKQSTFNEEIHRYFNCTVTMQFVHDGRWEGPSFTWPACQVHTGRWRHERMGPPRVTLLFLHAMEG